MNQPLPLFRVFISSPSDVRPERLLAERVIERVGREFSHYFRVEPVLWEREPLLAGAPFQQQLVAPHETDLVVVLVWSLLGTLLSPKSHPGPISNRAVTGTEWEFEDALESYLRRGTPSVILYRKNTELIGSLEDEVAVHYRLEQKRRVEDFMQRWTRAEDGSFTSAFWEFSSSVLFETLLEQHLRDLLRMRISAVRPGNEKMRWHDGSPFRGLESFELKHESIFFGRTRARNELRELLAKQQATENPVVLVMGASGCGKSSLIKAGLLADLRLPGMIDRVGLCRHAILRPGQACLTPGQPGLELVLANALLQETALPELGALQYDVSRLAAILRAADEALAVPIHQGLAAAAQTEQLLETVEARLVVFVDQLEELFTNGAIVEQLPGFVATLRALVATRRVWLVATLRSDFFERLAATRDLKALFPTEGIYALAAPEPAEIGQMIRRPALEAGLQFQVDIKSGRALDEMILEAAVKESGSLPLLSFLLSQLWQKRDEQGYLTLQAYADLNGLEGSLGKRADEVFETLPHSVKTALPELLRGLVTMSTEYGGVATARSASLSSFPMGSPVRNLLDALLDPKARLIISDTDANGGAIVRIAHEALLRSWPAASLQIAADKRDLQLRAILEQAARRHNEENHQHRASRLLPPGLPLEEARSLVERWGAILEPAVVKYVESSARAARRGQYRKVAAFVGALIALPLVGLVVWALSVWHGVRQVEAELKLVSLSPGCFRMGSPPEEPEREADEGPVHEVCLEKFALGEFEVTQRQWQAVMNDNPSAIVGSQRPVENMTFDDVQHFIGRMNRFGSRRYRLPSEAEWEYAARAGNTGAFAWGEGPAEPCKHANINDQSFALARPKDPVSPNSHPCTDGYYQSAPVGSFPANAWGLHDMTGNVWEWVEDSHHGSYANAPRDGRAWVGGSGGNRVFRGGGWHSVGRRLRFAERDFEPHDYKSLYNGFRLAAAP